MKVFLFFSFFTTILSLPIRVHAEYRVFNLKISKPNPDTTQPPIERTILSNLDPRQYKEYYPLAADESIDYTETWMCKGRTDMSPDYCPNPNKAQIPSEPVSNQNTP